MKDHLLSGMYILNGKIPQAESDIMIWGKFMESGDRIVKQTELPNGVRVSTVFLGIDHSHSYIFGGEPLLFETMIFGGEHDEYCERYSTWEEAEAGHQRAIELIFA